MNISFNLARDILAYASLVAGAFLVLASRIKSENLKDLKDRVDILENALNSAKSDHIESLKAIANLEGQLSTYKEIPLKQIANSLTELSGSNAKILTVLEGSALIAAKDRDVLVGKGSEQHVETQIVDRQVIK